MNFNNLNQTDFKIGLNKLEPLQFRIFQGYPNLKHAFSTRDGGVSKPPFDSLNLGLNTNDNKNDVNQNRKLFYNYLNIDHSLIVCPQQTHSANITRVDSPGIVLNCDSIITDRSYLFLSIQTADCFPVFLYDPAQEVIGLVHSGWRGTSQNIAGLTVEKLNIEFQSIPSQLKVAIGPGILQRNYQVDEPVAQFFSDRYLIPDSDGYFKLDIRQVIIDQLIEVGVKQENIEITPVCSFEETSLFYSHRRDGNKSGRMMGLLGMT